MAQVTGSRKGLVARALEQGSGGLLSGWVLGKSGASGTGPGADELAWMGHEEASGRPVHNFVLPCENNPRGCSV